MYLTIELIKQAITYYNSKYRHQSLPPLELNEIYSLDKDDQHSPRWPDGYPSGGEAGIYIVLDSNKNAIYIGKASGESSCIANRLGSYFQYGKNNQCITTPGQTWQREPRYILTLGVEREQSFEAPALEEYLLKKFKGYHLDNKILK